jgi:hypothetical protein
LRGCCTLHAQKSEEKSLGILSIVFVMIFVTFFELGPGPIPWAIGGEIFTEKSRATAMCALCLVTPPVLRAMQRAHRCCTAASVCGCVHSAFCAANNWFANTIIALFFPSMESGLGHYTFLPFAGASPRCLRVGCGAAVARLQPSLALAVAGVLAASFVFIVLRVPETKGKTLQEIQHAISGDATERLLTPF